MTTLSSTPTVLSQSLRAEADAILNAGLRRLLDAYGETVVHGSYGLDLMAWRDLDIYVAPPSLALNEFFTLGGKIADLLGPHRMHFRDERAVPSEGLPRGLYWGMYLRDQPWGAWKIDLWAVAPEELRRLTAYEDEVGRRLTAELRSAILNIKAAVCQHPEYRRGFSARYIYDAVLDGGVRDVAGFAAWLQRDIGLQIQQ